MNCFQSRKKSQLVKLLSLEDAWRVFLERPSCASFTTLRELVLQEAYAPSAVVLVELAQFLADEEHGEVVQRVEELMPAWALCPRIHYLAGCAAEALGDEEEAELCHFLSISCIDGILRTGDGSRSDPWLATYPSDARDCLTRLGLTITSQQLLDDGDRLLDVMTADDEKCYCFDVTELVAAGAESESVAEVAGK